MTKRTEKTQGRQAGNAGVGALGDVLTPLIAGMTATRAHLLEWGQAQGMVALQAVFATEAAPRGNMTLPGASRHARHSPEGDEPPSSGCPFGLIFYP